MSRNQSTPGPWRIVRSSDYTEDPADTTIQSIEGADGRTVYYTESGYFKPLEADARLIAAAPDMREALEATDITLTNMLQVFSEQSLSDSARVKVQITRDRLRALLARIDGDDTP